MTDDNPVLVTEYDDGSTEYNFEPSDHELSEIEESPEEEFKENIVEYIDEHTRLQIAADTLAKVNANKESRSEWLNTVTKGLALLGIKLDETNDPFPGACSAHHPLILESAVKFQAKASNELFSSKGPVKTQIIGEITPEKEEQADRVLQHMNYQIMHEMEEYFDETETMLFYLPIVGSAFKKTYYNALLKRPCSEFIPVENFVVNYFATNLGSAQNFTHIISRSKTDFEKDIATGMYEDPGLLVATRLSSDGLREKADELLGYEPPDRTSEGYVLLEHYDYLFIEEDSMKDPNGLASPYIITVEQNSGKLLSVRRGWAQEDNEVRKRINPFTHYKFVPGMGFYGLGYIHLLGNLQMSLTTSLRNLLDAGAFANLQAGFVDKRLRVRDNKGPFAPGQFKEVEAGGIDLEKAIKLIPFKEPSQVLMAMYQFVEARGQKFADSTEQVIADSTNYGPVGTTLALLEASTKFFSGVHRRMHNTQKAEFKILAGINYEYLEDFSEYETSKGTFKISKADYDGRIDIVPVSDPNVSSQSQRITVAQAIYTAALQNPGIHNMPEVSKYYYSAIGLDTGHITRFLPDPAQPQELDPLGDIQAVHEGKPIKAFPGQDHEAHIQVKTAFLQDPMSGANPMMASIAPKIQANIQEHMILKFKESVAGQVGSQTLPATNDPKVTSQIVSQAAKNIANINQKLAQAQMQGPDAARDKLADAEIMRAVNEGRRLESETLLRQSQLALDALKLELEKVKEANKMAVAGVTAQNKQTEIEMKKMSDLLSEAVKLIGNNKSVDK